MSYAAYTAIKIIIGIIAVLGALAMSLRGFARTMDVPNNKTEWK